MPDTRERPRRITGDTPTYGKHMRITDVALDRAKTKFGTEDPDELAQCLGLANRMTLWRLRYGRRHLTHAQAIDIATRIGWDHGKVFVGPESEAAHA